MDPQKPQCLLQHIQLYIPPPPPFPTCHSEEWENEGVYTL